VLETNATDAAVRAAADPRLASFGMVADQIVRELAPRRLLDAGCAKGFLVQQLRERGVEAFGIDISEYAISEVDDLVQDHCLVASLTNPIEGSYDLVTCFDVLDHMPPVDARVALDNLCRVTTRILLSSAPVAGIGPVDLDALPDEQWAALLADNGFSRDSDHDPTALPRGTTLYVRTPVATAADPPSPVDEPQVRQVAENGPATAPPVQSPAVSASDAPPPSPATHDAGKLYGRWYYDSYTMPYEENDHWTAFFGGVADAIVGQLNPTTLLDAGCAKGFLVSALRERGVDAKGFDLSEVAIESAPAAARGHVRVGSLTEEIPGRYDLVTCIEVIEHLDPADAARAVANLSAASDRVLLSSTPADRDEPTHVNIQPPERWSQLFAAHGMFRDFRHDASYLSPWAVLYRRGEPSLVDVVLDYDRAWSELRVETLEQRKALLDMQSTIETVKSDSDHQGRSDELAQLRKEVLRLRDLVIGREAELATALGRVEELDAMLGRFTNLEQRLNEVLESNSWRLSQAAALPLRKLRERKG
jgi:2-polyprenyl-3-methyl-5-hydroxy-6-metoxy-1,4-benzoquinol methylase